MTFSDDLTSTHVHLCDLRPGMRLTPLQSRPPKVTEAETDHVIAETLAKNRQTEARAALPAIAPQDELLGLGGRNARREAQQGEAAAARMDEVSRCHAAHRVVAEPVEDLTKGGRSSLRRLGNLGPWPRRGAIAAALVLVAYIMPWVLSVVALVAVLLPLSLAVLLGTDRMARILLRIFQWLNARWPDRAERFRIRVDWLATGMDALLDRLPERWTTGLYMPDFSREALLPGMDAPRRDPFERIAAEARGI